jgi:hypothetical protein
MRMMPLGKSHEMPPPKPNRNNRSAEFSPNRNVPTTGKSLPKAANISLPLERSGESKFNNEAIIINKKDLTEVELSQQNPTPMSNKQTDYKWLEENFQAMVFLKFREKFREINGEI